MLRTIVLFASILAVSAKVNPEHLRCLVCRTTLDEFDSAVSKISPKKTVEVGGARLDAHGNLHQDRVHASKSQVQLSEMLDDVCEKLDDYVRVRYKATGKLTIMKLMTDSGQMNPDFSYTEFVTDDDLNKSLKFYCEGIIGENEEDLINIYMKRTKESLDDIKGMFCIDHMKICQDWMLPNAADKDWNNEKEKQRGPDPYGFGGYNKFDDDNSNDDDREEPEEDVGELEMKINDKEEL